MDREVVTSDIYNGVTFWTYNLTIIIYINSINTTLKHLSHLGAVTLRFMGVLPLLMGYDGGRKTFREV